MKKDNKDILIVIALFIISFILRVVDISKVYLYPDEWAYWYKTNTILVNNWVPTEDIVLKSSPFLSYIGAIITVIFGGELNTFRMVSVIFGSLTPPMLYLFGKTIYDRKTGLLSALLMSFSAFHILWSRIFMLEAITVFFITAFLYFYWLSLNEPKNIKYIIFSGAMLGLGIAAKYLPFFLVPAILAHAFWTGNLNLRSMIDRRIVLIFVVAFLFFSPLLLSFYYAGVDLEPIYYQAVERFTLDLPSTGKYGGISEKIINSIETQIDVLSWGNQILVLLWKNIYWASVFILLMFALISNLPNFLKKESKSSFLLISIFMYALLLINLAPYKHYLLYFFPFFFVIIANFSIESLNRLRKENDYKNIIRIFTTLLISIMMLSSVVVGTTSSSWDFGEYSWAQDAVKYIKNDAIRSGLESRFIIGWITIWKIVDYSISEFKVDAAGVFLLKMTPGKMEIDMNKIDTIKPEYILVGKDQYHFYFKEWTKNDIFHDYRIIYRDPENYIILKRKTLQSSGTNESEGTIDNKGTISQDLFKKSIPSVMKVGTIYDVLIKVTNTGDMREEYSIIVHSDEYTIFVENSPSIELDGGSSSLIKIKLVPIKEYAGILPVTATLYVNNKENGTFEKADSSLDYIYFIEK